MSEQATSADPVAQKLLAILRRTPDGVLQSDLEQRVLDPRCVDVLAELVADGTLEVHEDVSYQRSRLNPRTRVRVEDLRFVLATPPVKTTDDDQVQPAPPTRSESLRALWREHARIRRITRQNQRKATMVLGQIRALNLSTDGREA